MVQVELVLRERDDENPNPTRASTTACSIEAASAPDAIREALWDVLCRSGYDTGQVYEMLAWVIDNLREGRERDRDPSLEHAEHALETAADLVLDAYTKWREKKDATMKGEPPCE